MSFSSVNADTIKWLHLVGEDSSQYPNMVRAAEEFEAKTGHTVVLQYLENESFKAKLPTMLQSNDRPDIFYSCHNGIPNLLRGQKSFHKTIHPFLV